MWTSVVDPEWGAVGLGWRVGFGLLVCRVGVRASVVDCGTGGGG